MMKIIISAALAPLLFILNPVAMATDPYISVSGGMPVTFSGSMDINMNGFPFSCEADLILSGPNDATDMLHASGLPYHTDMKRVGRDMIFSGGGVPPLYGAIILTAVTSVDYISTNASTGKLGDVILYGADFTSSFNGSGCIGDLVGHWDENAQTLTFNAALPASPVCHFSGVLVPNKLVDFSDAMDAGH